MGLGPAGLLHLQLSKNFGAKYVIGIDLIKNRLEKAQELGADYVFKADDPELIEKVKKIANGFGINLIIVAAGSKKAINTAIELANPGGTVCLFADTPEHEKIDIEPNLILHREVNIVGSYSSTPFDLPVALDMISTRKINVKTLISHIIPFDEIEKAVTLAVEKQNTYKIIISFNGGN
jgi:L-iditol 2-dehydrogenase